MVCARSHRQSAPAWWCPGSYKALDFILAYRLAKELGLAGFVRNDSAGVVIEVEDAPEPVAIFAERLVREAPEPTHITSLVRVTVPARDMDFTFADSAASCCCRI